ncbi:MAG: putative porin [Psychroserpens sp.]|uniref:putative porin n=1 Tax=Psychroserpens sp. TaxID=2020870 RepID=UPI003C785C9E
MKKYLAFIIQICCVFSGYTQVRNIQKSNNPSNLDSITYRPSRGSSKEGKIKKEATIDLYKIISIEADTTYVDTSLTIKKEYKFNYLRKDQFALLPFSNLGQTYNQLSRDFASSSSLPQFGARARHFNYMEVEDIFYYEVPTPLTELFFKTAFEQGQLLDAFFTVNTSRRFNFSLAYKGLRSLGNYQNSITSTGNLRFTTNYHTQNKKYQFKAHITTQDLLNEENGGLKNEDIENFTSGDEDFIDRSVFEPNFQNAENILLGKRFYFNHQYNLIVPSDSTSQALSIKNVINFEDKYFRFDQSESNDFFGEAFKQSNLRDKVTLENFETKLTIDYKNQILGNLSFGLKYNDVNYGYDKITVLDNQVITNRIKDQILAIDGTYSNTFGELSLNADLSINVLGDFNGSYLNAETNYRFHDDLTVGANLSINSSAPNYNTLLYQSNYVNYNWDNSDSFENQTTVDFGFVLQSERFLNVALNYSNIDRFTFFSTEFVSEDSFPIVRPAQLDESISLLKIRIDKEIKVGKFALDNSIMYQNVSDDSQSLNLPEFILRNTLYYSNHFFSKKALFLQTGITFNYFTDYYMDGYDPLLAEFYSQRQTKINGFPRLDFFVNAKIRQTRIFLKAEHFNSAFTGYNYFSTPNVPYRDFAVRFGLVWNFFL